MRPPTAPGRRPPTAACRSARPGVPGRSRSIGPDTLTAATTARRVAGTAALTDATPALALLDALDPARSWSPRSRSPTGGAPVERQRGTHRHDRAQPVGRLERRDADPLVAVAHVELHALAGRVPQRARARAAPPRPGAARRPRPGRGRPGAGRARTGPRRRAAPGRGPRAPRPAGGRWPGRARWPPRARPACRGRGLDARRAPRPPCRARRHRLHWVPHSRDYSLT